MEFDLGNGVTLMLPSIPFIIIAAVVIYLLKRWGKEMETRRLTLFFYFLISAWIIPLYTRTSSEGTFELMFPVGFIVICFYLYGSERYHRAKLKASLLGFAVAVYQLVMHYLF
ncbi:hypothetical protein [Planococcus sp. CAU13]|uniref:hypothetical protein n=1 Tax=Planococcus sp. CAU13 TaxID=1541197 RepID=UPI00052FF290|nr:hypothetical protein [Planococcus sp. CAU13]